MSRDIKKQNFFMIIIALNSGSILLSCTLAWLSLLLKENEGEETIKYKTKSYRFVFYSFSSSLLILLDFYFHLCQWLFNFNIVFRPDKQSQSYDFPY